MRLGAGNLKSLVVAIVLGIFAYMTLRGLIGLARMQMEVTNLDLEQAGFEIVFLRHNMTALARKVRAPIRSPHKIPGNYQRNMHTLRWSERVTRLYWTWIASVLSGAERHGGFEPYYKIRTLHALVLSHARRNEFFHRRRVTGY